MICLVLNTDLEANEDLLLHKDRQALSRLIEANEVKLYSPPVFSDSMRLQRLRWFENKITEYLSRIEALIQRNQTGPKSKELGAVKRTIEASYREILQASERQFLTWFRAINQDTLPLGESETKYFMAAYHAQLPVSQFLRSESERLKGYVSQVLEHAGDGVPTVIISKDEALSQACKPHAHITCCRQLIDFIKRNDVQSLLRRLDRGIATGQHFLAISRFQALAVSAGKRLSHALKEHVIGLQICDLLIPNDDNMAHIIGMGECGAVKAEFSQPIYFGAGDIGLEFELDIVVDVSFDIFKVDYFSLRHKPRIMAEYEHHVRVKDRSIARVKGVALIPFCLDYLAARNKGERLPHQTIKISSIDDVTLRNYTLAQVDG